MHGLLELGTGYSSSVGFVFEGGGSFCYLVEGSTLRPGEDALGKVGITKDQPC